MLDRYFGAAWARRRKLGGRLPGRRFEGSWVHAFRDGLESLEVIEHANVWTFYQHIGFDHRKNRFIKREPSSI